MANQVGKGGIYGLATLAFGATLGFAASPISGYISPKFETLTLSGQSQVDDELGQTGEVDQIVGVNRGISCQFRFKPRGTSFANADKSLSIPDVCGGVNITGLDIIACFGFADVFNTNGTNTQPWIFKGEFSIEGTSTGLWTANITLGRHLGITSASAIV